jgi:transposase
MGKPYSMDLRERVVAAVDKGGLSCHRAAAQFTLRGLVAELAERGLKVDYRLVWESVHAENLSLKKSVVASEPERPDVARRRAQWAKYQGRIEI